MMPKCSTQATSERGDRSSTSPMAPKCPAACPRWCSRAVVLILWPAASLQCPTDGPSDCMVGDQRLARGNPAILIATRSSGSSDQRQLRGLVCACAAAGCGDAAVCLSVQRRCSDPATFDAFGETRKSVRSACEWALVCLILQPRPLVPGPGTPGGAPRGFAAACCQV